MSRHQHTSPREQESKHGKLNKGCVTLWPCHLLKYHKAKEELWKLKYFTMRKCNLQKNPLKKNQNPSRYYYNSIITNLKFQYKPKYYLSKILILKKIDLLLLLLWPRGQIPWATIVGFRGLGFNESKTQYLCLPRQGEQPRNFRPVFYKRITHDTLRSRAFLQ